MKKLDAEALLKLIRSRRSIRKFKPYKLSKRELGMILEAARWAPSGLNVQPWQFIVVQDKEKIAQLARHIMLKLPYSSSELKNAACVIAVIKTIPTRSYEIGAAIQNMLLVTHSLGLASCWVGSFNKKAVSKLLKIPPLKELLYLVIIGKPAEKPKKNRKPLSKIAFSEEYGNKALKLNL